MGVGQPAECRGVRVPELMGSTPDRARRKTSHIRIFRETSEKGSIMDRLTIPDEPIEGGMRRSVVDARAVKEQAMGIYWRLKAYEDTGMEPEEIEILKEKQTPKKMVYIDSFYGGPACPACNKVFTHESYPYCPYCGQVIDWGTYHF